MPKNPVLQTTIVPENPENKKSAVEIAINNEKEFKKIEEVAKKMGMFCSANRANNCATLIKRADENPRLFNALAHAKKHNVNIFPENKFYIGNGWVDINIHASDEDIIKFLLGE